MQPQGSGVVHCIHDCRNPTEQAWVHTQVTVRTSSESLAVFLRGCYPFAEQGGATRFDDVRVVDLGPWMSKQQTSALHLMGNLASSGHNQDDAQQRPLYHASHFLLQMSTTWGQPRQ